MWRSLYIDIERQSATDKS